MFRTGRMKRFVERFAITGQTTVLDMGGGAFNWTLLPVRPRVTILDVYDHDNKADWATYLWATDATPIFLMRLLTWSSATQQLSMLGD
jgi:hypothetical protein